MEILKPFPIRFESHPDVRSNVIVSSHERSGTHFTINSIALNSIYNGDQWISLDPKITGNLIDYYNVVRFKGFLEYLQTRNCRNILKSHLPAATFHDPWGSILSPHQKIIYIYRDALSTLASYLHFILAHPQKWTSIEGPNEMDFFKFMMTSPAWGMLRYQVQQVENIFER